MKKVMVFFTLLLCCTMSFAGKINQVVFFGDSLSDNGNLYHLLFKILPKSPPYFQGRFSNGPTWAEHVGRYYYDKNYARYKIYALGGATAVLHAPSTKFISPTILELEIDQYLIESLFKTKRNTLFAIWIGGNDYLFDQKDDANKLTSNVVGKIAWGIKTLIDQGGRNFLVLNLPDLSRIPFANGVDSAGKLRLQQLAELHNQKLEEAIKQIKASNPDVKINFVNAYDIFNEVITNPEIYNQKYHVNIKNTGEACWQGKYWLKGVALNQAIENDMRLSMNQSQQSNQIDSQAISDFIQNSPAIQYAYSMGKMYEQGNVPCANASEYLFWDQIHPTAPVHQVLSQIVIENLTGTFA